MERLYVPRLAVTRTPIRTYPPPARPRVRQLLRRQIGVTVLAVLSIAIVVIYVHDWPKMGVSASAPAPINLARTGISPEIEAAINGRFPNAGSAQMPITPESADRFAGVPVDPAAPLAPYGVPMPQPHGRSKRQADEHKAAAGTSKSRAH